ncbi:MAG: hypothetical protein Fur0020_05350 [Thermodesulfovibrionia bacterium]
MKNIHLKKEGKRFLIAVALIGFASLNTGNNLIYLIFSMMLSITLISFLLAVINLSMVRIMPLFREPIYAGCPFRLDIDIENSKPFPSYSISILPPFEMNERLFLATVKRGNNRVRFDNVTIKRRGRYNLSGLSMMTGFPFIFMHLYKMIGYNREVIVYPQIVDVLPLLKDIQPLSSEGGRPMIDHDGDFLFTREYVFGEESRRIDWKATARTQKVMTKVFSRNEERLATIILDNGGMCEDPVFEKAVSVAASLVSEFIQRDYHVRLITCGKVVPFGKGKSHLFKVLDILAGIGQLNIQRCPVEELREGLNIIILCSESSGFSDIIPQCTGVINARDL